jgi:endo-1,3(4)-beta-glucanase
MNLAHQRLLHALLVLAASRTVACSESADSNASLPLSEPSERRPDDAHGPGSVDTPVTPAEDLFGGPPLSTTEPAFEKVTHPVAPSALLRDAKAPLPTNAFWENLIIGKGEERINVLPYLVRTLSKGLAVSAPRVLTSNLVAETPDVVDLVLGATSDLFRRQVIARDDLSVTVEFANSAAGGSMTTPLVQGMAYVTARYAKLTPVLATTKAILSVTPKTGTRFEVTMNDQQKWLVYTSSPITLTQNGSQLVAAAPFDGDLRIALATSPESVAALDAHRASIPLGGSAHAKIADGSAIVELD